MREKLKELKNLIELENQDQEKIDLFLKQHKEFVELINDLKTTKKLIKNLEIEIKKAVEFDGENKKIFEDILTVKVDRKETVDIQYEENKAVDYCMKHELYQLLTVKKADFEKLAASLNLEFCHITRYFDWTPNLSKTKLIKFDFNEGE
jgi:hypothetical protein